MVGRIKATRLDRGFGFLVGPDRVERFFHASQVQGSVAFHEMSPGDEVYFEPDETPKGPAALLVGVLPPA